MTIEIKVSSSEEFRELVERALVDKGVDRETAKYLAGLAVESPRGREIAASKAIHPMGGCSLPGLFPG